MTSIFSGQLYRNFVKDQNTFRLENYDVNRFQRTIQQQAAQGQREKSLREGLEFHQAIMADLQTKLSEVTEKLNNLYRRFMENQTAFLKSTYNPTSTANAVAGLPRVDDPAFGNTAGYPAGAANILPQDDYDKIRNYSYNPYFGSKAIDQSDKNVIRTFWQEPGVTDENAYRENGAFWSTISYLWGWDIDRINATYATGDIIDGRENVQINVTALAPNKPQYPPLATGDRFPLNWIGNGGAVAGYPAVNISGIRPGGADYSHASDTINTGGDPVPVVFSTNVIDGNGTAGNPIRVNNATGFAIGDTITVTKNDDPLNPITRTITNIDTSVVPNLIYTNAPAGSNNSSGVISKTTAGTPSQANLNVVGKDEVNMGWEFDDLPLSLEVTGVTTRPDGTTTPSGYRVVYDIPPTHPFYNDLKVLNGTEPQILDAPASFSKDRINNDGFDYTGTAFIPGTSSSQFFHTSAFRASSGPTTLTVHNPGETEYPPPRQFNMEQVGEIILTACNPISINTNTSISMKYRYAFHQHAYQVTSPSDESLPNPPATLTYRGHDWNNQGDQNTTHVATTYQVPNPASGGPAYSVISNAPMGAGFVSLGQSPSVKTTGHDAYGPFGDNEELFARIVPVGGAPPGPNQVRLQFFFNGDINFADIEVQDVQVVTYNSSPGGLNSWTQGLYDNDPPFDNADPLIGIGNPNAATGGVTGPLVPPNPDTVSDVINKFYPNVFQFTQFNDTYNVPHSVTGNNDVLRSPWEFAMLNIGQNSGLSGELWIDINGQRVNLDHDRLQGNVAAWAENVVAVSNPGGDYIASAAVQAATDFTATVTHPDDSCGTQDHDVLFYDSDPLNNMNLRTDTLIDEVREGENPLLPPIPGTAAPADPGRTSNPGYNSITSDFYEYTNLNPGTIVNHPSDFVSGGSNDTTGTADRIHASDGNFSYTLTIPTSDVNVLKNENNILFNFGAIPDRDWSINIENPFLDMRTISGYKSLPRYRVDDGGNIYDLFGKGYYDTAIPEDVSSIGRLYTSGGGTNGQISNFDRSYGTYSTAYNAGAGSFEAYVNGHDRLSMGLVGGAADNDDYNLFDYTPDLNVNPASKEGATFGESYIGSLPSNFYYYRETLDQAGTETASPSPAGTHTPAGAGQNPLNFNNDNKAALNFDGNGANRTGDYRNSHTYVYNTEMPSFANVRMGVVEQDARWSNTQRTGTFAVWQDFPGLGSPTSYAIAVDSPPTTGNVLNPVNALGESPTDFAQMGFPASTLQVDLGTTVNNAGYLIISEQGPSGAEPHAIPLPLTTPGTAPFPSYTGAAPQPYTFNSYGTGTVTRTGSKFMNFQTALDGVDGTLDGAYNATPPFGDNQAMLEAAGGQFASSGPFTRANAASWPSGVMMHVDNASAFTMTYPQNVVTLGTNATRYVVAYRNDRTEPETIFLVREDGAGIGTTLPGATTTAGLVHADLQIQEVTGTFTVNVTDAAGNPDINGSHVKIDYADNGTQRPARIVNVGVSSAMDRVGRIPGNDPRTTAAETLAISPEVFANPKGYVQPDAQVDLHVVSHDKDDNKIPRKLMRIRVETVSGEQIIPSDLQQVYTTYGVAGDFSLNGGGGAGNNWPIAVYDGNVQINPLVTNDMNYLVGFYQGITAGATLSTVPVVDASDFKVGHKVTINGEQRLIQSIAGNTLTLDRPLSNVPVLGDRVDLGDGTGNHDLKLFLNRSFAMSMGAGLKITAEYEEYEYRGYPPTVFKGAPVNRTEVIGFSDNRPKATLGISPTNTGDGTAGNPLQITGNTATYAVGDNINVNGQSFRVNAIGAGTLTLGDFVNNVASPNVGVFPPPKSGTISHVDYQNFLVTGKGRSGGSQTNEFTQELKRIVDNPEYKELFRHNLFKGIFITASVNDPFNDLLSTKLFLNWDRTKREVEIMQSSFTAYYKSI